MFEKMKKEKHLEYLRQDLGMSKVQITTVRRIVRDSGDTYNTRRGLRAILRAAENILDHGPICTEDALALIPACAKWRTWLQMARRKYSPTAGGW